MKIIFATQNQNKVSEIQRLMPNYIEILSLKDIDCFDDIPETAMTLEGNAQLKSVFVQQNYQVNCFADDTGLEIESLNGEPGVMSARYASEIDKSDERNMDLVLEKLKDKRSRKAQFRTVISLQLNGEEHFFEGIVKGEIANERKGEKGFGYDPIFVPDGFDKSFAEMSIEEKNAISHRGQAVRKLISFLS